MDENEVIGLFTEFLTSESCAGGKESDYEQYWKRTAENEIQHVYYNPIFTQSSGNINLQSIYSLHWKTRNVMLQGGLYPINLFIAVVPTII